MTINQLINGAAIFKKYFEDPDGYHIAAEHDQIFVYPTDFPISGEDLFELRKGGWFQEDVHSDEDDPSSIEGCLHTYAPREGWSHFT